jgi:serine/threonine protein kinase
LQKIILASRCLNPAAPNAPATVNPPKLPEMELVERIGSGAYGEVWLARSLATGAARAVKIVFRSTFSDERPFNREFEGIRKFEAISHTHPSQLALFQVGRNETGGYFYYVMELADSASASGPYRPRTLRRDLERGRIEATQVLEIARSLAEALAHLHANKLIHRDVKPANIIFVNDRPKLADIGLVTDASDSGSIVGTEGYLAPEGPGTPQADLFALGKVLYESLTGLDRRQFPELPADIRHWLDAKLAFELNTIILKLCAAHAKDRYSTATETTTDLEHLARGKSVQRRYRLRHVRSTTLKTTLVVTLLRGAFTVYRSTQKSTPQKSGFANSGAANFAAWEAWSRAETLAARYSPFGLSNAITYYERALELDPNYTAAWVGLSGTAFVSVEKGFIRAEDGLPRSRAAAEKALMLDPNNALALQWKANCILASDYDFVGAEPLFKKAIQTNPENTVSRHNYAGVLWKYGRFDEAEEILSKILRDAPQQGHSRVALAIILAARGKLPEALSQLDDAILLLPAGFPVIYFERGILLWKLDRRDEACRDWLEYIRLGGYPTLASDDPALAAAAKRSPDEFVRTLIAQLEKSRAQGNFISSFDLARFYALLGDKPRALDHLEASVNEHCLFTLGAKYHIAFRELQEEPRYHTVLHRLKLEQ